VRRKAPAWDKAAATPHLEAIRAARGRNGRRGISPACLIAELKELMWRKVGPFRTAAGLTEALDRIRGMREQDLPDAAVSGERVYNASLVEWFELRSGLLAAEALALSALNRRESRGAHQRDDFPQTRSDYSRNQRLWLQGSALGSSFAHPP